jgi:hypothetical protein
MDRRAGACGASFLPFSPSFQCLSSAFRTDSFVLPISDPLTGLIDGETRLGAKVKGAIPKVGRFKARVCQTKGGNLSVWATNLQSLRRSRRRKNRQGRLQRSRKAARLLQRSKLQNPRSKKGSGEFGNRGCLSFNLVLKQRILSVRTVYVLSSYT